MCKISKKRAERNRQRQSKRIQKINNRKKKARQKRKMSDQQKLERKNQLEQRKAAKQRKKEAKEKIIAKKRMRVVEKGLFSIFHQDKLDQLAKIAGFIKRKSSLTAFSFMYIISFGFFGNGFISLSCLACGLSNLFHVEISPQGLSKRINSKSSTKFLLAVLTDLIKVQLSIGFKNSLEAFSMFKGGVMLQDSTTVNLNEKLSEDFVGYGGGASKSAVKIDFIYDVLNLLVHGIKIVSGTVQDQSNSKEILLHITQNSLTVRDLGYLNINTLKKIQKKLAYYLSRLSIGTYVYLQFNDENPINLPEFLEKQKKMGMKSIDLTVYLGKEEKFATRLVAEQVPEKVKEQRKNRYARDNKKQPSDYYVEFAGFSIFITNIPEDKLPAEIIIAMYKIRWQIELTFKNFKSNIELDILKGTNKHRIESLIYGKLITIATVFVLHNYAEHIAEGREVSADKLTKWLKSHNRIHAAILNGSFVELLIVLEHEIIQVCKQSGRKKETTREYIKRVYQESFMQVDKDEIKTAA